jgi:hypothetical protein
VSVLLGTGNGAFATHTDFAVGTEPRSVAIGDVNGDGKLDLVVANFSSGTLSVLLGDGVGSFALASNVHLRDTPTFVRMGDLNGDGNIDLAVAANTGVWVLLGDGHGSFTTNSFLPLYSGYAVCVAIGDLNGDGNLDLVSEDFFGSGVVWLGDGHAGFGQSLELPVGVSPAFVEIRDVNGDGANDLVFANEGGNVVVFVGNGAGAFDGPLQFDSGGVSSLAVGDLNGDGRPDVVGTASAVPVLLNKGNGTPFFAFCSADFVAAEVCPCRNPGLPGHGCQNSASTGGARLSASGDASLAADTVHLGSTGELPTALSVVVQGNTVIAPTSFGDGLRCAGGTLERLYVEHASAGSITVPQPGDASISARSAALGDPIPTGATRVYQVYYRDADLAFCPGGFNATSAVAITWGQ